MPLNICYSTSNVLVSMHHIREYLTGNKDDDIGDNYQGTPHTPNLISAVMLEGNLHIICQQGNNQQILLPVFYSLSFIPYMFIH